MFEAQGWWHFGSGEPAHAALVRTNPSAIRNMEAHRSRIKTSAATRAKPPSARTVTTGTAPPERRVFSGPGRSRGKDGRLLMGNEREGHLVAGGARRRNLELSPDLLDELAHESESERAAGPFRLPREADAVILDREASHAPLLAGADLDHPAAPPREGVLEGIGEDFHGDEGERDGGIERNAHRLSVELGFDASQIGAEPVGRLADQLLQVILEIDRGEIRRLVEQGVHPGHGPDAPDRALERL